MSIDKLAALKLFTIKKNQLKLVKRRGYNIGDEEKLLSINLETFLDSYIPFAKEKKQSLRNVLSRPYSKDDGEKIAVYYADLPKNTKQLGIDDFGSGIEMADKSKSKNLILITPVSLSAAANKKILELVSYNIYIFLETEMTYDPTEHYFTPEHKSLSVEEQRDFLIRNNLSIEQLPIILTSDMMVRYYGFLPGQIIEIKRTNFYDTIVQNSLSYRAVKEDVK